MRLAAWKSDMAAEPYSPYWTGNCSHGRAFPLCQGKTTLVIALPAIFTTPHLKTTHECLEQLKNEGVAHSWMVVKRGLNNLLMLEGTLFGLLKYKIVFISTTFLLIYLTILPTVINLKAIQITNAITCTTMAMPMWFSNLHWPAQQRITLILLLLEAGLGSKETKNKYFDLNELTNNDLIDIMLKSHKYLAARLTNAFTGRSMTMVVPLYWEEQQTAHAAVGITTAGPGPLIIPEVSPVVTPEVPHITPASCGQVSTFDERILNGRTSVSGQFPWMVHLSYFSSFHKEPDSCGGSLISNRWVITAAQCFRFLNPNIDVYVKIGYTDRFRQEPESSLFGVTLEDIIIHGGFTNVSLDNNIAIVHLPEDVTLNRLVQPICLATNQQISFGAKAVAAGWGLRKPDNDLPDILQSVELDVLEDQSPRCANSQLFICTFTPGKDTCRGDSGGPLMTKQGNTWFQIGIVSSGLLDCGNSNIPGTYTRVPNYMGFLL
ncbi:unnamed protein product [Meganyctiphanes norvegica]|uniref:Peptidase S1 domain-containing protein n=1 Tax=Meganyctiphanes norvegica TaxID=48144 RepID=A0AAV2RWA7_MEGNR